MKTGSYGLSVTQVNYAFDNELTDPDALLDRYTTLTGWAGALLDAGARRSAVVQRFRRSARVSRGGVDYQFVGGGLARSVAALGADIVHVNGIVFPVRTWRLRRALPASACVVVQSHSDGGAIGRAPMLRLAGRALRGAVDAFLFAADEHAASWRAAGLVGPDQEAFTVMPASTTLRAAPRDAARAATGIHGAPAILWVGRLNANKDPLTVLDAFESAAPRLGGATLTMVFSTTELADAVGARVGDSAVLRDRVRLVGSVAHDRMALYFSAADIFIVGSHHEGSGYALMEAMACGATPVVTDIPTFRALTGGGAIGRLWRIGDASACTAAIVDASRHVAEIDRERVCEFFAQRYSWSAIGRRAMDIYSDVHHGSHRS